MTDDDFLQAILANPDDDAPRLVYADWLEERGDARAEFIRVQIELSRMSDYDPRRGKLLVCEKKLLAAHHSPWEGDVAAVFSARTFRRGFLDSVQCAIGDFIAHGESLLAKHPVRSVRFAAIAGPADSRPLLDSPLLARLSGFAIRASGYDLSHQRLPGFNDECVTALLASPHLGTLAELEINDNHLTDKSLLTLASDARLSSLRTLNIAANAFSADGISTLLNSQNLKGLKNLVISRNRMGPAAFEALAASSVSRQLTRLVLSRCKLGTRGLQALRTGTFDSLSELDISNNHIGVLGGAALADTPFLRRLDSLNLANNRLEDRGVAALAAALAAGELKQLNLRANRCGSAAAAALAAVSLPLLEELDLRKNSIGVPGVRTLASSESLPCLTRLDVRSNNLGETERAMLRTELGRTFGRL